MFVLDLTVFTIIRSFGFEHKISVKVIVLCFTVVLLLQVYLIENKEESLMKARQRVGQLALSNVVLFQVA